MLLEAALVPGDLVSRGEHLDGLVVRRDDAQNVNGHDGEHLDRCQHRRILAKPVADGGLPPVELAPTRPGQIQASFDADELGGYF